MKIQINGEARDIETETCLSELLERLGYAGKKIAVELNREIIPSRLYGQTRIRENDQLEIVHAIGGG